VSALKIIARAANALRIVENAASVLRIVVIRPSPRELPIAPEYRRWMTVKFCEDLI